jgi:type VI secretion system protein
MSGLKTYGLFEVFTQQWLDKKSLDAVGGEDVNIKSIQDHMSRLLNARQGVLTHLPDYGLPDITHLYGDLPYSVDILKAAIAQCIEKFEPRLYNVEIVALPQDRAKAVLIFEIRATLINGGKTIFETYLLCDGNAKVTSKVS